MDKLDTMTLEIIDTPLSVCKVKDYSKADLCEPFTFIGCTDHENSLVCPTNKVPENTLNREDGWRAFRVAVSMEFSLVGILYRISKVLAEARIGIFAISTFDTDYILTKEQDFEKATAALKRAGYKVLDS